MRQNLQWELLIAVAGVVLLTAATIIVYVATFW